MVETAIDNAVCAPEQGFALQRIEGGSSFESAYGFLSALFGNKPGDAYILIWRLRDKRSFWFTDIHTAAAHVADMADENVYVGVALAPRSFGPKARCEASAAVGIGGLWIDLDVVSPAHKKRNLPPTIDDALALIPSELPPTLVIGSGHGLQAWWVSKEPWIFDTDDERGAAAELAVRFNSLFKHNAAVRGWDVDSTADLARVLRVPGTTNTKLADDHRPVLILREDGPRYNASDIAEYLDACTLPPSLVAKAFPAKAGAAKPAAAGSFILNAAADPPFDGLQFLSDVEPRFLQSWEHQRTDLQDQSASSYDLSLATFAAIAKWTDQQIVNLLIAHRRKHGQDLKLRVDYYERTLRLARQTADEYWAEKEADSILGLDGGSAGAPMLDEAETECAECQSSEPAQAQEPSAPQSGQTTPVNRQKVIDALAKKLRVPLTRIVKFAGDPGQYRFETTVGAVQLGGVDSLITQHKLRRHVADSTGRLIPLFDSDEWQPIAQGLLDACELVDRGQEATLKGAFDEFFRTYLHEHTPYPSLADADGGHEPFFQDGRIHIFLGSFQQWLQLRKNERMARNRLTADLRACGAVPRTLYLVSNGRRTSRSVWELPDGPWDDELEDAGE